MRYLFVSPKNEIEKRELKEYISTIEEAYNGKFVFGKEKELLFKEVKEALQRKMKSTWKR